MKLLSEYLPATRGKIIVWGLLASYPFGGMVWQVYHYLVSLRRLGFDVWYVEDSSRQLFDPLTYNPTEDFSANVALLSDFMEKIGFEDRWIFGRPSSNAACVGATDRKGLEKLYRDADAAINLCGAQELQNINVNINCLIYIETDPVQKQVEIANGVQQYIDELDTYQHLFTYGENLGADDCLVPIVRYNWQPTRPPVCVDLWSNTTGAKPVEALTSVANWKHATKDVVWQGKTWRWSKHHEFIKYIDLPTQAPLPLELAVGAISNEERTQLNNMSWRTIASTTLNDPNAYRRYIQGSLGEFTVAKEQYVCPKSGWFSDRSVCYLAAGRPVITQETGFSKFLPTGKGLFAFQTMEDILTAMDAIKSDYEGNCRAARDIATEYFAAEKVIGQLMKSAGF